jgi:LPS sulfotransferase NodH
MRLPRPFYQLPVLIDALRLRDEVASLPSAAWVDHPDRVPGNSAVRLITADGRESDEVSGDMRPTPWLEKLPYLRQILSHFGVVWSRSRLMRLAPYTGVPEHADVNYNWHSRVRMHIPVTTSSSVRFHCGHESVHMATGEAWIFDNWRRHRVTNESAQDRIHLVADTTGTSAFWRLACGQPVSRDRWRPIHWQPDQAAQPLTERDIRTAVMPPAEVQWLLADLESELTTAIDSAEHLERAARFRALLESFVCDWRQLCLLHGLGGDGREQFERLATTIRDASQRVSDGLVMRTNQVPAAKVLESRVLTHLLPKVPARQAPTPSGPKLLARPIFIVAAPRSGSTLLFETLAVSRAFNTLGGEAHWLIEDVPALRPDTGAVESNRLTAADATPEIIASIRQTVLNHLQGPNGALAADSGLFLEKTPKNALRIPFLTQIFPDARFIFLWRDPRENIASIMEAWRAGRWTTYPTLAGWTGPWSLLLPPGWSALAGAGLEDIAAFQWRSTNEQVLADFDHISIQRRTIVSYADLVADPLTTVRRICEFLELPLDPELQERAHGLLPYSRNTNTPPRPDKWRQDEDAILRVVPGLESCWRRLERATTNAQSR